MYRTIIGLTYLLLLSIFIQQSTAVPNKQDLNLHKTGDISDILHVDTKDIWVAIISGIIGFAATHLTTISKAKKDLMGQYDIDLRNKRIQAYTGLWDKLYVLRNPEHSQFPTMKYKDIQCLLSELTYWYYKGGNGMFLSENSRGLFFRLLKEINEGLKPMTTASCFFNENTDFPEAKLGKLPSEGEQGSGLRRLGSRLRTSLLEDVGTRGRLIGITYGGRKDPFNIRLKKSLSICKNKGDMNL
jgi:hypothetical protein